MHLVERLKYLVHNNIVFVLLSRLEWNYADLNVSNRVNCNSIPHWWSSTLLFIYLLPSFSFQELSIRYQWNIERYQYYSMTDPEDCLARNQNSLKKREGMEISNLSKLWHGHALSFFLIYYFHKINETDFYNCFVWDT